MEQLLRERVLSVISQRSRKNPIKQADIQALTGATDTAFVRRSVRELREEGFPICSNHKGYWYSRDRVDSLNTIAELTTRRDSIDKHIKEMEKLL